MSVTRALACAAALAACGCGGDDDAGPDAGPPAITIGTGYEAFEPLTDGDDIYIVQGPQGGFHFFGSFYATGIEPGDRENLQDPNNPTAAFRVLQGGARVDIGDVANTFTQGLEPIADTGGYGTIGRLVILDITDDAQLAGAMVRMEVELTDVHGRTASDARMLTAVPHPNNP